MDILVQYPSQIGADGVHPYDHGDHWIDDELDPEVIGSNLVAEIGNRFRDHLALLSTPMPLNESEAYYQNIKDECEDAIASQAKLLIKSPQTCLNEDANTSSLGNVLFNEKVVRGSGATKDTESNECGSMRSINPTSDSSALLPAVVEVVSAMKGSRQKRGLDIKKLSVTWAPDVYDPPVTPRSRPGKRSRQQHSRLQKKSHRRKLKPKDKTLRSGSCSNAKKQHQL